MTTSHSIFLGASVAIVLRCVKGKEGRGKNGETRLRIGLLLRSGDTRVQLRDWVVALMERLRRVEAMGVHWMDRVFLCLRPGHLECPI
jgi:hypothetical protein